MKARDIPQVREVIAAARMVLKSCDFSGAGDRATVAADQLHRLQAAVFHLDNGSGDPSKVGPEPG